MAGMAPAPDSIGKARDAEAPRPPAGMAPGPEAMAAARKRRAASDTSSTKARQLRQVSHALWFRGVGNLLLWMELMLANDRQFEIARTKFLDSANDTYREMSQAITAIVDGTEK